MHSLRGHIKITAYPCLTNESSPYRGNTKARSKDEENERVHIFFIFFFYFGIFFMIYLIKQMPVVRVTDSIKHSFFKFWV